MELSCLQEKLNKAINISERIVIKNTTLPILENLLLETDKGRLKISATNLEIGISTWIGAKITKEGTITIPTRLLSGFISRLPNKKIDLQLKDSTLNIKSDGIVSNLKGISATDFPIIPKINEPPIITIEAQKFSQSLQSVINAVGISEIRPEITGVFLDCKIREKQLIFAATDSYRLAEKTIELTKAKITEPANDFKVIIPRNTAGELIRIIENLENEENLRIALNQNQILFLVENTNLISRLLEGQFPDYKQIIPTKYLARVVVDTRQFIDLVKIASIFADTRINSIKLQIKPNKSLIEINSEAQGVGDSKLKLKANIKMSAENRQMGDDKVKTEGKVEEEPIEIIFNYKHILDGLNNITTPQSLLEISGPNSPTVLRPTEDKSYLYIIMPLKL